MQGCSHLISDVLSRDWVGEVYPEVAFSSPLLFNPIYVQNHCFHCISALFIHLKCKYSDVLDWDWAGGVSKAAFSSPAFEAIQPNIPSLSRII